MMHPRHWRSWWRGRQEEKWMRRGAKAAREMEVHMAAEIMTVIELRARGIREGEWFELVPKKNRARFQVMFHTRRGKVFRIECDPQVDSWDIISSGCPE